jgi:hypothetical protein
MQGLLSDKHEASRLGEGARRQALKRFNIRRFVSDWNEAFAMVAAKRPAMRKLMAQGEKVI